MPKIQIIKGDTMKGYIVPQGYMGFIPRKGYILFATQNEYEEYYEEYYGYCYV